MEELLGLSSPCCGAVNVLATFGAIAFVDSLGRRKLLIIASIWMFVTQIVVAGLLGAEFQQHGAVLPANVSVGVIVVSRLGLFSGHSIERKAASLCYGSLVDTVEACAPPQRMPDQQ